MQWVVLARPMVALAKAERPKPRVQTDLATVDALRPDVRHGRPLWAMLARPMLALVLPGRISLSPWPKHASTHRVSNWLPLRHLSSGCAEISNQSCKWTDSRESNVYSVASDCDLALAGIRSCTDLRRAHHLVNLAA